MVYLFSILFQWIWCILLIRTKYHLCTIMLITSLPYIHEHLYHRLVLHQNEINKRIFFCDRQWEDLDYKQKKEDIFYFRNVCLVQWIVTNLPAEIKIFACYEEVEVRKDERVWSYHLQTQHKFHQHKDAPFHPLYSGYFLYTTFLSFV